MCENCPLDEENCILRDNNEYLDEQVIKLTKSRDIWRVYAGELALKLLGVSEDA